MNFFLYCLTVLIWGSTWLAIELQLGAVAPEVSVFYRFALAAIIMWLYCLWARLPLSFSWVNHGFLVLLGLGVFSVNYLMMYFAQQTITSAMASIAFSTLLLMNIVLTRLFFGKEIETRTYLGAVIGVGGIVALFWEDLRSTNFSEGSVLGLTLILIGTLIASLGNMVSVRNSNQQLNIFSVNAWAMTYGSIVLFLVAVVRGASFTFSTELSYVFSLLYLVVFGTVIAFASYFVLLKNIGPEKASYAVVLFPLVAVVLSSVFEGFVWTRPIMIGFAMVLLGNFIVLTPAKTIARFTGK